MSHHWLSEWGHSRSPPHILPAAIGAVGCCDPFKVSPLHPPAKASKLKAFLFRVNQEKMKVKLTAIVISVEWCITSRVIASTDFIRVYTQYAIM